MIKKQIEQLIKEKIGQEAELEHPADLKFGDYSTNLALKSKIDPDKVIFKLKGSPLFEKVAKAGPGFINFYLSPKTLYKELVEILKQKDNYGNLAKKKQKIQVEFISANPTGPLTVGNARGGPYGDTLANVLRKAGFAVEKAYYVNDSGQQILALGHSVLKTDQAKYRGKYIDDLAGKINEKDPYKAGELAAKHIINDLIKKTTDKLGIKYDEWIFESDLHKSSRVERILQLLEKKSLIYFKEGAKWFKSTKFGDNRDRVLVKKDGSKTYLAGDIALHQYKFKDKKFDKVINEWGADHHGDIAGLMAGIEALGYKGKLKIVLHQFVTILEKGKAKRMSKRSGVYVYMDELLDKIGKDAARFFFLQKSLDTHLNFDLDLAKERSSKNPVFYVQYAYARISSILRKADRAGIKNLDKLTGEPELNLIRRLAEFPEIIEQIANDYQVQRLAGYSLELANDFHKFYELCRVIDKDKDLTQARLNLVKATQIVLRNVLGLMGIEAPKKM